MDRQTRHAYAVVALGSVIGASARALASSIWPAATAVFVVNILGAGLLAIALVWGERSFGPHSRWHHLWRPFAATGVLGGFTTTSAWAVLSLEIQDQDFWGAVAYRAGDVAAALAVYLAVHALAVRAWNRRPA